MPMRFSLKRIALIFSLVSLAVILISAALVFRGRIEFSTYVAWTTVATLVWFLLSPLWLISKKHTEL
jgi:hypothetical protein